MGQYPGRPVHLIGHSGGAALAVWTLEALPESQPITSAVLFGPALSPSYCLTAALRRTQEGIHHFWSPLDLLFLAAGTLLFRTADGKHAISAGFRGFSMAHRTEHEKTWYRHRLTQRCFSPRMLGQFHWGGHFGWANRVFIAEEVAPLLASNAACIAA